MKKIFFYIAAAILFALSVFLFLTVIKISTLWSSLGFAVVGAAIGWILSRFGSTPMPMHKKLVYILWVCFCLNVVSLTVSVHEQSLALVNDDNSVVRIIPKNRAGINTAYDVWQYRLIPLSLPETFAVDHYIAEDNWDHKECILYQRDEVYASTLTGEQLVEQTNQWKEVSENKSRFQAAFNADSVDEMPCLLPKPNPLYKLKRIYAGGVTNFK